MKRLIAGTAIALAVGMPLTAGAYLFDPDGAGPEGSVNMTAFDWAPSNVLVDGGNEAVTNFLLNQADGGNRSVDFKVYAQAQLLGTTGTNITGQCTPGESGCNGGNYEITYTFGFTETVTAVALGFPTGAAATAAFAYVDDGTSFFEMFYDTNKDSNNLTGAGFDTGTLILSSEILPLSVASGSFTAYNSIGQPFDFSPDGDDYAGISVIQTPPSQGSQSDILINFALDAALPLFADPTRFLQPIDDIRFNNTSISPQFSSVNPSALFDGLPGAGNAAVLPSIGTVNGGPFPGTGGPDIQLQTDTNVPIRQAVPEPSTLALMGLGLAGIGFTRRWRRRN